MRKSICGWITVLGMLFGLTVPAHAILIDNGDGTVTDNDLGIMWLQSPGPDLNVADALAFADSLVFAGFDDWRLPSALNFNTGLPDEGLLATSNEFGHLYGVELGNPANLSQISPLQNYTPLFFWTGTTDPDSPGDAFAFFWSFDGLWENLSTADEPLVSLKLTAASVIHVTAVRDIAVTPAPEPSALLLLGLGVVGTAIVALRRRLTA